MPRAKAEPKTPVPMDGATYNRFVAGVHPVRIELSEIAAHVQPSDAEQMTLQVESQFETKCISSDGKSQSFLVEARLQLHFSTGEGQEAGQFLCVYRMAYQSSEALTDGAVDLFVRRNAPLQVWPFMRELVLSLTQRFGWAGFMLPSFLIPPASAASENASSPVPKEGTAAKDKKPRKAKAEKKE